MFRSSRCAEHVLNELDVMYDKVDENPDVYLTGFSLENIDGFTFVLQCVDENDLQMIAILAEEVAEQKVEALVEQLAEINKNLRFFSLFLDDNNNVILGYTYFLVQSFEESVHQVISLMNSMMQVIDDIILDIKAYI